MKSCKAGYVRSKTDTHKRCVRIMNASVCRRIGKFYNRKTNKCRKRCKHNQVRHRRSDNRGTLCKLNCKMYGLERGKRYCRKPCKVTQKRVNRADGRGSRCVNRG